MKEIERRRLLGAGAAAISVGLAGCLGGGDGGDDSDDSSDDGNSNDGENSNGDSGGENGGNNGDNNGDQNETDPGQASFDSAVETLAAVEGVLATYRAVEGDPTAVPEGGVQSEDIEELRSQIDDAAATLSDIDAEGDLATQVSIAQDVVAFQRTLVDALSVWQQRNEAYQAAAAAQANEEYETAAAEYSNAVAALAEYRSLLEEIETAHAAIDSENFEVDGLTYGEEVWAYLRVGSRGELDAREQFLAGEQSRTAGIGAFATAEQSWDAEEWAAARESYETARSAFEEASTAYESALENGEAPPAIEEAIDGRVEEATGLAEAMGLLIDATEEAEAGNLEEAGNLRQQAREEFA